MTESFEAQLFGYIGGGVLAICTIPQIITMIKNQSAQDISMLWAVMYCVGLSATLVYMCLINALAGIISISIEVLLSIVIIVLKVTLDHRSKEEMPVLDDAFTA